jgi:hypothetical protein
MQGARARLARARRAQTKAILCWATRVSNVSLFVE